MNFYSKHASPLFQKVNSTLVTILQSKTRNSNEQISLYEKIVNELLKNNMMEEISNFQQAKLLALQLVLMIAQNNDSSFHSISYWQNMLKSNQVVSYFASISNLLRAIQEILIDLQSEQGINQNKIKIRGKQSKLDGRPLTSYLHKFSNLVQTLQQKFREGATKGSDSIEFNHQENEALIQQLQNLIQKRDLKIKQISQSNKTQTEQFQLLLEKLQSKNLDYTKYIQKLGKQLSQLKANNIQNQIQKSQLKQINADLEEKLRKYASEQIYSSQRDNSKFRVTQNTIQSLSGETIHSGKAIRNSKQKCQELTSLKSFRRINNKQISEKQVQKWQNEQNLMKILYCQAQTIENLL